MGTDLPNGNKNVHKSFIHNSEDQETPQMTVINRLDKQIGVYSHTTEHATARK